MYGEALELSVASAKGVVGEGREACVAKWVEIVGFSDFCHNAGEEVMGWHIQEVAEACKYVECVSDVVWVGGVREHEG